MKTKKKILFNKKDTVMKKLQVIKAQTMKEISQVTIRYKSVTLVKLTKVLLIS